MSRPVTKVGNLTKDPELRFSAKGTPWTAFRLAVTPYTAKHKRIAKDRVEFYDVRCFRSLAENVAESIAKGDRVIVQGDGEVEDYTKADGTSGQAKVILANAVGVELRFATATIQKVTRESPKDGQSDDVPEGTDF